MRYFASGLRCQSFSALAVEACFSAQEIVRNKETARGACWCNPTLTGEMWRECRAVAAFESWTQVFDIALPGGRLNNHLTDASYIAKDADAPRSVRTRSGVCGNAYRKSLVDKGILRTKNLRLRHKQFHRGKDSAGRRRVEYDNLQTVD